ncbi:hypothetical protein CPB86DRAFT_745389 [Serendipita vermifera]|nr:hypothetical protein CPB86DRAFT_745389 [Serendipita vermifera]
MEAALFGRLEIVQTLLKSGADKDLINMEKSMKRRVFSVKYPLKALDFARDDTGWTAKEREKYFPGYKESHQDTIERQAILDLLSHETKDGLSNQVQIPRKQISLILSKNLDTNRTEIIEKFSLGITDSGRTVAVLDRGPQYSLVVAVSGWAFHSMPSSEFTNILSNSVWTDNVLHLAYSLESSMRLSHMILNHHRYDRGIRGIWEACHAEKQLMIYYLFEHHIHSWDPIKMTIMPRYPTSAQLGEERNPQCAIQVNNPSCSSCTALQSLIEKYFNIDVRIDSPS